MEINLDLHEALVEVRKAYRLIALYQRRILDLAKTIQKALDYKPYYYVNQHCGSLRSYALPTDKESLAMLPLYMGLSMLYLPQKADSNYVKIDEWLLEIRFDNDSGFIKTDGGEPNPKTFEAAEKCASQLWLCAFGSLFEEKLNWYNDIYNNTDWPKSGERCCGDRTYSIGKSYDLAAIGDEAALKVIIEDFKTFVETKQNELDLK